MSPNSQCVEVRACPPECRVPRRADKLLALEYGAVLRLAWLLAEFMRAALSFPCSRRRRSEWLQTCCRRVLRVLSVDLQSEGPIPTRGLLVSNHLSYLDILILGALSPAVFIAKREVRTWPMLGWFAHLAGTIFVDRERRLEVARSCARIHQALVRRTLVVLFPEGTSSGGETVLPFKPALLAPVTRTNIPVSASYIRYTIQDGTVSDDVCYWRDMTFVPHLIKLLCKRGISAHVSFTRVRRPSCNRKDLAQQLYAEVTRLKAQSM